MALTGYEFCNAAEILRYNYPGWKKIDTENMTRLMMSAFYPTYSLLFSMLQTVNWDGAIMHTLLAIAVFTDNRELFDNAVYHYLHANANGSLIKYIYPTGQCQETRRIRDMSKWDFMNFQERHVSLIHRGWICSVLRITGWL